MVAHKPPPLFKYHSGNEYLDDVLIYLRLYGCPWHKLNDPLDCRPRLSHQFLMDQYAREIDSSWEEVRQRVPFPVGMTRDEYKRSMLAALSQPSTVAAFHSDNLHKELNLGVCCFTTSRDLDLMWTYYADGHKGLCLEFDFAITPHIEGDLKPVVYRPELDAADTIEDLRRVAFQKKDIYSHECEWRIVKKGEGHLYFSKAALKAIHFGANASSTLVERVRALCKKSGILVPLYQAHYSFSPERSLHFTTINSH